MNTFRLSYFHHNFPILYTPNHKNRIISLRNEKEGFILINPLTRLEGRILFSFMSEVQKNQFGKKDKTNRLMFENTSAILKLTNLPRTQFYIRKIGITLQKISTMSITILDNYQLTTNKGELTSTPIMSLLHKGRYNDTIIEFNRNWMELNTRKKFLVRDIEDTFKARSETTFNFYSLLLVWKPAMEKQGSFIRTVKNLSYTIGLHQPDPKKLKYELKKELEKMNQDFNTNYQISFFSDCAKITF